MASSPSISILSFISLFLSIFYVPVTNFFIFYLEIFSPKGSREPLFLAYVDKLGVLRAQTMLPDKAIGSKKEVIKWGNSKGNGRGRDLMSVRVRNTMIEERWEDRDREGEGERKKEKHTPTNTHTHTHTHSQREMVREQERERERE